MEFCFNGMKSKSLNIRDIENEFIKYNELGKFGVIGCKTEKSQSFWMKKLGNDFTLSTFKNEPHFTRRLFLKIEPSKYNIKLNESDIIDVMKNCKLQ